jgi:hypothetical protein
VTTEDAHGTWLLIITIAMRVKANKDVETRLQSTFLQFWEQRMLE